MGFRKPIVEAKKKTTPADSPIKKTGRLRDKIVVSNSIKKGKPKRRKSKKGRKRLSYSLL
jgi:hypothetical protein